MEEVLERCSADGWISSGAIQKLTPRVLKQINELFKGLSRAVKIQCLLSFAHAKGVYLAKAAQTMQSIIDQAVIDPDQWVQGLARLLDGYPEAGMVQCWQVDNEFVYRLAEALDAASGQRFAPDAMSLSLHESEYSVPLHEPSGGQLAPREMGDFVLARPASMSTVEEGDREEVEGLEICPRTGMGAIDDFSLVLESVVGRPTEKSGGNFLIQEKPDGPARSIPKVHREHCKERKPDGLEWDVAGLEAAESAAVRGLKRQSVDPPIHEEPLAQTKLEPLRGQETCGTPMARAPANSHVFGAVSDLGAQGETARKGKRVKTVFRKES